MVQYGRRCVSGDAESVWIYSLQVGIGLACHFGSVEISFEPWHYNWAGVTIKDVSASGVVPSGLIVSLHYFF